MAGSASSKGSKAWSGLPAMRAAPASSTTGSRGCRRRSEAAQQIGARGVQQVIAVEIASVGERADDRERCPRAVHHRDGRGSVQGDDGGGLHALQEIVEANDLGPVRVLGPRRLAVQGGDRRLQRVLTRAAAQGLLDERQRLVDLRVIPATAILLLEE